MSTIARDVPLARLGGEQVVAAIRRELERVNKELWLVLSLVVLAWLLNSMVTSQQMLLGFYTLPTIASAYLYGRRHATLTAFASVLLVVYMRVQNPELLGGGGDLFEGEDCVFEGYSARLKLGPWLSPWLTGAMVRFEGEDIAFNAVSRALNKTVQAELFRWSFDARQGDWQIRWHVEADREDFAGLDYVNPDGGSNFCLNSKIATCNLQLSRREGGNWQQVADLWGRSSCAYEILVQDLDHGVPILA